MNQKRSKLESGYTIHPSSKIGAIALNVSNLGNQIDFYQKVLAFQLRRKNEEQAALGTSGRDLLILRYRPGYKRYSRSAGLYHFAVLYPNQGELAGAIGRLFRLNYPNSPTDHIMTKTTYLDDPEGNGIELYAESPEDGEWFMNEDTFGARRADGSLSDGREPLDLEALFRQLEKGERLDDPVPPDTRIGHVHLYVGDIDEAIRFYNGIIGFDIMGISRKIGMAFVSAGGYHHHIGLNTWQGKGIPPAPPDALGLEHFSVELPDRIALDQVAAQVEDAGILMVEIGDGLLVSDPNQIKLLLKVK